MSTRSQDAGVAPLALPHASYPARGRLCTAGEHKNCRRRGHAPARAAPFPARWPVSPHGPTWPCLVWPSNF